jgi:MFS family permease
MFMDISSEMIHALLPVYMVSVLGASTLSVGFIEGIAEATASITKVFSGALSDWFGKRKLLAVIGYGLAAFTKPIFPLAPSLNWLIAARFIDRIGKGIRGAPRDALVADISPPELRGASFGLRQSLDTIGAFVGPLVAVGLMLLSNNNYQLVFWIAAIPGFAALALMMFAVKEPEQHKTEPKRKPMFGEIKKLPRAYWIVVVLAAILTLARFSEAFLILRAQNIGLTVAFIPVIIVLMNIVYAISAYPAGALSDRIGRYNVFAIGVLCLSVADLVLAFGSEIWTMMLGVAIWGLHMGLTQSLLTTLVADTAPSHMRGTAFGIFNCVIGIAMLCASVIAGGLWDQFGPQATFFAGAAFATLALIGFATVKVRMR